MPYKDRIIDFRRVSAAELRENPNNFRTHPRKQKEAMLGVLNDVGWADAVLAREVDGVLELIDGHLRADIANGEQLPVLVLDVNDAEAAEILATHDPIAAMAGQDDEKLDAVLRQFNTGDEALQGMLSNLAGIKPDPVTEDEAPEPPADPITKSGDLWLLGEHQVLCGDSTKADDVERLMGKGKINLAFISPPYASQRKYDESSGFKPINPDGYVEWFADIQQLVHRFLAADGSWVINITEAADEGFKQTYVKRLVLAHVDQWNWRWIEEYCWPRPALPLNPNSSRRFKNGWESVYHFAKVREYKFLPDIVRHKSDGVFSYADQKAAGKMIGGTAQGVGGGIMSPVNTGDGLAYPSNVLANMGGAKIVGHSAAFPVGLPTFFLQCLSETGDRAYDPFLGSGTTLIAAEQLSRKCYGMEISPAYCDVIVERWQNLTGGKATRQ